MALIRRRTRLRTTALPTSARHDDPHPHRRTGVGAPPVGERQRAAGLAARAHEASVVRRRDDAVRLRQHGRRERAPTPRARCGPWRGARTGWSGRRGCACADGSRAPWLACGCSAGTCASSLRSPLGSDAPRTLGSTGLGAKSVGRKNMHRGTGTQYTTHHRPPGRGANSTGVIRRCPQVWARGSGSPVGVSPHIGSVPVETCREKRTGITVGPRAPGTRRSAGLVRRSRCARLRDAARREAGEGAVDDGCRRGRVGQDPRRARDRLPRRTAAHRLHQPRRAQGRHGRRALPRGAERLLALDARAARAHPARRGDRRARGGVRDPHLRGDGEPRHRPRLRVVDPAASRSPSS